MSGARRIAATASEVTQISAGAAAIKALVYEVWSISEETVWSLNEPDSDESIDARDYPRMVSAIELAMGRLVDAPAAFRQGALRAFADILANWGDNTCGIGHDWEPLRASEAAFLRAGIAAIGRRA